MRQKIAELQEKVALRENEIFGLTMTQQMARDEAKKMEIKLKSLEDYLETLKTKLNETL